MKSFVKIGSFLMAAVMAVTAFVAAGCTPVSLNAEWAYKTSDQELAIGVYIYALDYCYSQAESYASDQLDDYSTASSDWLDEEIKDDDGNTEVARDWIKEQAETMCLSMLAVDKEIADENVEISTDDEATAEEQAEEYWTLGQYASYGYYMPMSDDLEPYGISQDSFTYCTTLYSTKSSKLFSALYAEGGKKAVSDDELETFFTENYVDYCYISTDLYTSTTDDDGNSVNTALSDDEISAVQTQFDGYAEKINSGSTYEEISAQYVSDNSLDSDPTVSGTEILEDSSLGDELKEAIEGLEAGKATTIQVGDDDTAVYYLVYKGDVSSSAESYISDATNRTSVLQNMKKDEYTDYVKELAKNLDVEKNTSVLDQYQPDMFFEAVEETTESDDSDDSDDSDSEDSESSDE